MGWIKINVDGSYMNGKGSYGIIARDHQGYVILSATGSLGTVQNAEHVEALAF